MIFHWLMSIFVPQLSQVNANAFDLSLQNNTNFLMFLAYMQQANVIFPIDEAYLPIFVLYTLVYSGLVTVKAVEIIINVLRGAGLKL